MNREIVFKIFRFNAEFDYQPHYDSFTISVAQGEVVLDALSRIKAEQDTTIAFRRSCRHGICGSCALKVCGQSLLACKSNIFALADRYGETLTIEPLDTRLAVKDLIVDKTHFWQSYKKVKPYLIAAVDPAPKQENLILPEAVDRLDGADSCIQCGACFYACPVATENDRFLGPAALSKAFRFAADSRDNATIDRLRQIGEAGSGAWECVKCGECAEACPKSVSPIDKIAKLKNMSFERSCAPNSVATRHAEAFKTSVARYGRLDETASVIESVGIFGALKQTREAFAMLRHGKLPLITKKIGRLDEVKTLIAVASRTVAKPAKIERVKKNLRDPALAMENEPHDHKEVR
ncbi:succinate dehydrogenase iron-sulfur subunit [Campylobacterota bacterium]|nr:succinate dehydrogenase iron-sulfur subunit [Campylobacterota bacterium]